MNALTEVDFIFSELVSLDSSFFGIFVNEDNVVCLCNFIARRDEADTQTSKTANLVSNEKIKMSDTVLFI